MDFTDDASTLISREFIAVVLAGVGNEYAFSILLQLSSLTDLIDRLLPLSSEQGEESCPKALLPIANKPMIDYPLTWLEHSGITGLFRLRFLTLAPYRTKLRFPRCASPLSGRPPWRNIASHTLWNVSPNLLPITSYRRSSYRRHYGPHRRHLHCLAEFCASHSARFHPAPL